MPKNFSVTDDDDFVTMEDPFTKETVNVPSNLKGFIKNIVAFNKKSGSDKLKAEYEELQGKFDTLNEEYEEAKKKSGGSTKEMETLKAEHEKALKKLNTKLEETERRAGDNESRYFDSRMDSELFSKLPVSDFHNASDAKEKIKRNAHWVERTNPATGEKTGDKDLVVTLQVKDKEGKIKMVDFSPEDGIKHFMSIDENKYLLKNKLAPGSGSTEPGNGQGIRIDQSLAQMSRVEYNKLNPFDQAKVMSEGKTTLVD